MKEETYRRWDIGVKIIAPIITIVGLLVGIWEYSKERDAQLQRQERQIRLNDELEFKRRLWEKQLDVYLKITSAVGQIAARKPSTKAIDQFYSVYWGDLIFVEDDKEIEQAMVDFHLEIHDYLVGIGTQTRLKLRANSLIKVLQKSSKKALHDQPQ